MKFLIVLSLCVAVALARSAPAPARPARATDDSATQILKYENDNIGIDGYNYAYETSDGVKKEESAVVNNLGSDNEELSVKGSYSWVADDGQTYTVTYIADKNGFQPSAPHLPVA